MIYNSNMIELLSDDSRDFIANRINNLHSIITLYVIFGWISIYHCKILIVFIPSMYLNWLIDDGECCINRLENYFRIKQIQKEGFINSKLKSINIHINKQTLNYIIDITSYISFLISYYKTI